MVCSAYFFCKCYNIITNSYSIVICYICINFQGCFYICCCFIIINTYIKLVTRCATSYTRKFNCFYCSYGNGVAAYTREVSARTEQYWCPIKHARRVKAAPDRYPQFFDYGDAEAYRQGLNRLRRQYREDAAD